MRLWFTGGQVGCTMNTSEPRMSSLILRLISPSGNLSTTASPSPVADVLVDLEVDLAVGELVDDRVAQPGVEPHRDVLGEIAVGVAREDLQPVELAAVHASPFVATFLTSGRAGTPTTTPSLGTSWPAVTTAPAPTVAPSPTVTGATSTAPLPMKAPAPMVVLCLAEPS
jgi:hypothetical protein